MGDKQIWSANKWIMVHSLNGILLNNKKKHSIDACYYLDEFQGNYAKWKKPISKKMYGIIPFIGHSQKN